MRRFASPGAFAAHLAGVRREWPFAERVALEHAGAVVAKAARDMIGTERENVEGAGLSWPPLAPSTLERKAALGQTGRVSATDPLLATGELRASIAYAVNEAERRVVIGTPDPVGVFHEFGTERMPPRPFLAAAMIEHHDAMIDALAGTLVDALAGKGIKR